MVLVFIDHPWCTASEVERKTKCYRQRDRRIYHGPSRVASQVGRSVRKLWPLHPLPSHAPIFSFSVSLAPTRCPILNGLRRTILSTPRWFLRLLASGPSLKPERRCVSPVFEGGEGKFLKRRNIFTRLPIIRRIVCVLPPTEEHSCGRALKELRAACSPGCDKNRVKSKAIPADTPPITLYLALLQLVLREEATLPFLLTRFGVFSSLEKRSASGKRHQWTIDLRFYL